LTYTYTLALHDALPILLQSVPKTLELRVDGPLPRGVTAKDIILYLIGQITTDGGTGYVIEYTGEAIRGLSVEERMTVCNMSIEADRKSTRLNSSHQIIS